MTKIAIIGRPNVGKSTLFNRLSRRKLAIVDDTPGVTRDRREYVIKLKDRTFTLIDTAGLEDAGKETLSARMRGQTEKAIAEADIILFMVDARAGITPDDKKFAGLVRKSGKKTLLLLNKAEAGLAESIAEEAYALGLGEALEISAEHNLGIRELLGFIHDHLSPPDEQDEEVVLDPENRAISLAIVGRPNAGKSTLINALIKEDRLLTGPEPGITRDAITVDWIYKGKSLKLIDTAGMRRKAKIQEKLENLSVADTLRSIRFAETVVLVLDAQEADRGIEQQDLKIARHVLDEGRALIIALNKWDAIKDKKDVLNAVKLRADASLPQAGGVEVVTISGLKGKNLEGLLDQVFKTYEKWNRRVSTAKLNRWMDEVLEAHAPPLIRGRRLKCRYITQSNIRPPTFALFCNLPKEVPDDYKRYLINSLRKAFDLGGVPVRLMLRGGGENPYKGKKKDDKKT